MKRLLTAALALIAISTPAHAIDYNKALYDIRAELHECAQAPFKAYKDKRAKKEFYVVWDRKSYPKSGEFLNKLTTRVILCETDAEENFAEVLFDYGTIIYESEQYDKLVQLSKDVSNSKEQVIEYITLLPEWLEYQESDEEFTSGLEEAQAIASLFEIEGYFEEAMWRYACFKEYEDC